MLCRILKWVVFITHFILFKSYLFTLHLTVLMFPNENAVLHLSLNFLFNSPNFYLKKIILRLVHSLLAVLEVDASTYSNTC